MAYDTSLVFLISLTFTKGFVPIFPHFLTNRSFPGQSFVHFLSNAHNLSLGDLVPSILPLITIHMAMTLKFASLLKTFLLNSRLNPQHSSNSSILMSKRCFKVNMSKPNFWYPPSSYQSYLNHSHNVDWGPLIFFFLVTQEIYFHYLDFSLAQSVRKFCWSYIQNKSRI